MQNRAPVHVLDLIFLTSYCFDLCWELCAREKLCCWPPGTAASASPFTAQCLMVGSDPAVIICGWRKEGGREGGREGEDGIGRKTK